ncbi:lipid II:glycine glycyltransferase FemX [Sphingomonas adhaesiva]|uniref:lipid II:glycine glycyltransferase FemX n=1 Tax=Sphingomonas adhaesiva TaxID=28212 RepID=UPI002FF6797F
MDLSSSPLDGAVSGSALTTLATPEEAAAFDAFLRDTPFAAYQQTRAWAAAAPASARRGWRWFFHHDAHGPIGAAVIRTTRLGFGRWLATIQRGPVVHDPARFAETLSALLDALRDAGCCTVQLAPRVRGRALPVMTEALRGYGFAPLPHDQQSLHQATGIVWLDKPEEDVLAGFRQRARRALRSAQRAGITVRTATGARDLAAYQRVLDDFAAARPGYDISGQPDAHGQAALVAACGGDLLLAERDGVAIGAHGFVRQADEAIWLSLATSDRDGVSPGYPLLWEAMRRARARGCVGYDLAGLPLDEPQDAGEAGRAQFKSAFAPHRRVMPPMQMAVLDPLAHHLLFGARQAYRAWRRRG